MVKFIKVISQKLRKGLRWLLAQRGTPGRQARGLAAGIFCGCFPLFGIQTILGILLANFLKGNKVLAAIGTWISNPFTSLPLYWLNYEIGRGLLKTQTNIFNPINVNHQDLWSHGWTITTRILIGSTFVGSVTALVSGGIIYVILKNLPNRTQTRKNK